MFMTEYDSEKPLYILYPDEPELQVYVGGKFIRFTNGRVIVLPGAGAELLMNRLKETSQRDYIFAQDLTQPALFIELHRRALATASKKAHASDAMKVLDEAQMAVALMLSQERHQMKRMNTAEVAEILSHRMPSAAAAMLIPEVYEEDTRKKADEAMIAASLERQPETAMEFAAEPASVEAPAPAIAVDPDSAYAEVMAGGPDSPPPEEDEPVKKANPFS
jgi:hypothetical protein